VSPPRGMLLPWIAVLTMACATEGAGLRSEEPGRLADPPPEPAPARAPQSRPAPQEHATTSPPLDRVVPFRSTTIPGGLGCLIRLRELGVDFVSLSALRGVLTPVRVTGPINGIRYRSLGKNGLVGDCRLVLALHRAGPVLLHLGVEEMLFSSAYSYRLMASGKLSQHAMGLAIDVHRVKIKGEILDVKEDFALGLENGCESSSPPLNRLACLLRAWGIFDWVLTPDFDRAHYNHFHLDIYCLYRRRYPVQEPSAEVDLD
jgi:hypothetical protein